MYAMRKGGEAMTSRPCFPLGIEKLDMPSYSIKIQFFYIARKNKNE